VSVLAPALVAAALAAPALSVSPVSPTAATVQSATRVEYGTSATYGLWSLPPTGGKVTLRGLLPGTRYLVRAGSGTASFTTPAAKRTTSGVGRGAILLDGSPFLPIMQWLQCPTWFATNVHLGVDVFLGRGCTSGPAADEVAALQRLGAYSVLPYTPAVKGLPGLFGWRFDDEPDGNGQTPQAVAAKYRRIRRADPSHLNFMTVTSDFRKPGKQALYRRYAAATDVLGFDFYPVTGWCRPDWLPEVGAGQDVLRRLAGGRPTYQWIEATSTSGQFCKGRGVKPAELRAEAWLAIASGAKGIGYFTHSWKPTYSQFRVSRPVQAAMRRTNAELTSLAPALLATPIRFGAPTALVCAARSFHGARYLACVNPLRTRVRGAFSVPGAHGNATVYGEGRGRTARSGRFNDAFAPLAVHVYVFGPTS
jgi:hypothetical protein